MHCCDDVLLFWIEHDVCTHAPGHLSRHAPGAVNTATGGTSHAAKPLMEVPATKRVICISPGTTLGHAYDLMREQPIRHLPVVDGKALVGIISDRDLLLYGNRVADDQLTFPGLPVSRIMSTKLVTDRPNATVSHVAALMHGSKVSAVLLTNESDGMLVGIVTSSDLLQLLSTHTEAIPFRYEVSLRD